MTSNFEADITIPEYFSGKTIFITGATGFIGKLLIEKLLRSCPEVAKIYILVRPRKGKSPEERVKSIVNLPIFDRMKEKYPENLKKIVAVVGDVAELGLGLSPEDRNRLVDEVNVVYHAAASVRFDDPLKDAILLNTRGTRETALLSKECKNIEVFIHVSTSYCNSDRKVIGEQLYPPHSDWREAIAIAEQADSHHLEVLTQKFICPLPNTYTFTKSLAEHVVKDLCEGEVPVVITRPSIVINTVDDPIPGWIDNFNGPVGILVASGKGILRSVYTQPDIVPDYVPVDVVTRALLITAWVKMMEKDKARRYEISVYNFSNNKIKNITLGELVEMGKKICWEYPLSNVLWYPDGRVTACYFDHFLRLIFYHLLPAMFIDGLLKIAGQKPRLFKIQRKIYIANMALRYFITQEWVFENDKSNELDQLILPSDKGDFAYPRNVEVFEFFKSALLGSRKYLLHEEESLEASRRHSRRMWILAKIVDFLTYAGIIYLVFFRWNIFTHISNAVCGYFESL